jgi:hypothetical protein
MEKLTCIVFCGDAKTTQFAQGLGVFESNKVVAVPQRVTLSLNPNHAPQVRLLQSTKEAFEKGGQRVVAIFVPGDSEGSWRDKTVKVISDGERFVLLDEALAAYDYVTKGAL